MIKFKEYLEESNGLHVFDIDETLFKTNAKIHVKDKSGKTVKTLNNQEFNDHKLEHGHHYDFHEFRDAKKFHDESHPIEPMVRKIQAISKNIKAGNHKSKIVMNTARSDFDHKEPVLAKFRKHGIDVDSMHIHRSGNVPGDDIPAKKKNVVLRKHLDSGNYDHVHMYDDSKTNLKHFLSLKHEYPHIKFHAHHVDHDGRTKKINEELINEAKYPDPEPMTQKSFEDVKKSLGKGKTNSMLNHEWFKRHVGNNDVAFKHGVSRAGFHEVHVFPYGQEHHTEAGVRPTTMLHFQFDSNKVANVHRFNRDKDPKADWKHSASYKNED